MNASVDIPGRLKAAKHVGPVDWRRMVQWLSDDHVISREEAQRTIARCSQAESSQHALVRLASVGYAVPGAVIVVGLLLPVGWVQQWAPQWGFPAWITATAAGIIWAYLVRFTAIALQSLQSGYTRIPTSLDESARMLGAGGLGLLLRPFNSDTLAVVAYQLARDERLGEAALPSLALVLVGLVPVVLLIRTIRSDRK
jgi:iron(III) transport system permease protein